MRDVLVSVVIPTYNRAGIISQTLDNLLEQSYPNFEIIVVDDGSTDETAAKLHEYGARIRVFRQANAGPAVARNKGVELARGEIIAFQDSDDLWKPTKLERQVSLLTKYGKSVPCCLCNAAMTDSEGRHWTSFDDSLIHPRHREGLWLNVLEVLATRFVLFNQTAAIWRSAFEKVGGFPKDLKYMEDYDLPLRLAMEGPWALIEEPLVIYRHDPNGGFSHVALKDPITLRECAVKVFERMLTRLDNDHGSARSRKFLKMRLSMLRRLLLATKLCQKPSLIARSAGRALMGFDHYLFAGFRRSPWFPQPLTVPSNGASEIVKTYDE
jgi:glycosyltransferase involved in cell wall biosynthesis